MLIASVFGRPYFTGGSFSHTASIGWVARSAWGLPVYDEQRTTTPGKDLCLVIVGVRNRDKLF